MKGGYVYSVVFILIVSVFFTTILAGANAFYRPKIENNEETALKRSVLYALGEDEDMDNSFKDIRKINIEGRDIYVKYNEKDSVISLAVPFSGPGLWGTISGYMGISGELSAILGIAFTSQNETPGLGGRIDEEWFKDQFRGLPVIKEREISYGEQDSGSSIDAVTGATVTSRAVLKIINATVKESFENLEVVK